jgi:type I restriction-modification system DNA methylase subunit
MTDITKIIDHIRTVSYMSGVEREKIRVKATGEVFTPTPLVQKMLDQVDQQLFNDHSKTFIDNSCGDGQFLSEILIRKIQNGSTLEQALNTIYGVDLMQDNVDLCRERLLCGQEQFRHIVEQNIVCADALRYHYRFDNSHPYDDEVKEIEQEERFNDLFNFE